MHKYLHISFLSIIWQPLLFWKLLFNKLASIQMHAQKNKSVHIWSTYNRYHGLTGFPWSPVQSTGVMYMKSTAQTVSFLYAMILNLQLHTNVWEQALFQAVIIPFLMGNGENRPLKYRLLPTNRVSTSKACDLALALAKWHVK